MTEFSRDSIDRVVESCGAGTEAAQDALRRNLGVEVRLSVGQATELDPQAAPAGYDVGGLAIVFGMGEEGALLLLPALGEDVAPGGESKLGTLARELGTSLFPKGLVPQHSVAVAVESLADVIAKSGVGGEASAVPIELEQSDGQKSTAMLIMPVDISSALAEPAESRPSVENLPVFTRSLLRIKVPVIVTLARQRQRVGKIMELGPGAIIQFDKSCEEMLDLDVGDRSIATGEAVKVGDKFGLRINSVVMPAERFRSVEGQSRASA